MEKGEGECLRSVVNTRNIYIYIIYIMVIVCRQRGRSGHFSEESQTPGWICKQSDQDTVFAMLCGQLSWLCIDEKTALLRRKGASLYCSTNI